MEIAKYNPGDKVQITPNPKSMRHCAFVEGMKHWADKVMTIREQYYFDKHIYYYMEEDINEYHSNARNGWMWIDEWIEGLAKEEVSEQDFLTVL